jgi:osmotically inducible protein OsmC
MTADQESSQASTERSAIMPSRRAEAEWQGNLKEGAGRLKVGSGAFDLAYSFKDRFENGTGTNPEELLGAAHAGCFTMALTADLTAAGHRPERIHTTATVTIEKVGEGFEITKIELVTEGKVPGLDLPDFQARAKKAKENCPVSKALASVATITLSATLG